MINEGLTFDDVLIIPNYSSISPKKVNVKTKLTNSISLNIPLVSSAMDRVTEYKLAIALAQEGGIGIIHKNMSIKEQALQVRKVKKFESGIIRNPIYVSPDTYIKDLIQLMKKNKISGFPVIKNNKLVGIITKRDIKFEKNLYQSVKNLMTSKSKLITFKENMSKEKIIDLMYKNKIERILSINKNNSLKGMFTLKDIRKAKKKPNSCKDIMGRLRVGAAIGVTKDTYLRVDELVNENVDVICVDTAHGHSKKVIECIHTIKNLYPKLQIIAGNVVTADAAIDLVKCGADAIKVGIGPGSICTTRIICGVGVPQITALIDINKKLKGEVPIISDGGIRFSGDIPKAIVAGASSVMIGGLFAGTLESPGNIKFKNSIAYKNYRGMGSSSAMKNGSKDRYFQEDSKSEKFVTEGIEGYVPYKGKIKEVILQLIGGLRSSMGYLGSNTIEEMKKKGKFIKMSHSSIIESHPHNIFFSKQEKNYPSI